MPCIEWCVCDTFSLRSTYASILEEIWSRSSDVVPVLERRRRARPWRRSLWTDRRRDWPSDRIHTEPPSPCDRCPQSFRSLCIVFHLGLWSSSSDLEQWFRFDALGARSRRVWGWPADPSAPIWPTDAADRHMTSTLTPSYWRWSRMLTSPWTRRWFDTAPTESARLRVGNLTKAFCNSF